MTGFLERCELPLLKRELVESAQRKRTYALRVLLLCILSLVFMVFYMETSRRQSNVMRILGSGRELSIALILTDLVAIYALLPAMACAAISSEREKQTLPLLLVSKLSPAIIVAEKFISRMLPMLSLLVITAPLLGVAYVLGGVTQRDLMLLAMILFTAAVQATSTAVFCSSLSATGLGAFWMTYLILAAMALIPPLLYMNGLLPNVHWIASLPGNQEAVPFTMFFLIIDVIWFASLPLTDAVWSCVPVWAMSAMFLISARFAVAHIGTGPGLTNKWIIRVLRLVRRSGPWIVATVVSMLRWLQSGPWRRQNSTVEFLSYRQSVIPPSNDRLAVPSGNPIAWRENRSSLLANGLLHVLIVGFVVVIQVSLLETEFSSRWDREGLCILVDVAVLIVGLLLMLSQSCHMFAAEREHQTLDVLLTIPISNAELLRQKQGPANRLLLLLMLPLSVALLIHLSYVQLQQRFWAPSFVSDDISWFSGIWWSKALLLVVVILSHAVVYLSIARWTGILFGLLLKSQMKAMIGSIISLLVLVFVPAMLSLLALLALDSNPDEFPLFCFSSPAIVYGFTLAGELSTVFRLSWFPDSEWLVATVNLLVYGTLMLFLRWQVLRRFPTLISRRDSAAVGRSGAAPRLQTT